MTEQEFIDAFNKLAAMPGPVNLDFAHKQLYRVVSQPLYNALREELEAAGLSPSD